MPEQVVDISDQVNSVEDRRAEWIGSKADTLLESPNKKELVVGLITDFNNILSATKEIERIVKEALSESKSLKWKVALREILRMFPSKEVEQLPSCEEQDTLSDSLQ